MKSFLLFHRKRATDVHQLLFGVLYMMRMKPGVKKPPGGDLMRRKRGQRVDIFSERVD
jgi:hypothetical protein